MVRLPDADPGDCDEAQRVDGDSTGRCLDIIVAALREAGAVPEHVVRTRTYVTQAEDAEAVGQAHGVVFGEIQPASAMVVVAGLLDPRWRVEIEAEAMMDAGTVASSVTERPAGKEARR